MTDCVSQRSLVLWLRLTDYEDGVYDDRQLKLRQLGTQTIELRKLVVHIREGLEFYQFAQ